MNFYSDPNINYRSITHLEQIVLWGGESVSVAVGAINPWSITASLSFLLLGIFSIDALHTAWRRGRFIERRRVLVVGCSCTVLIIVGAANAALVHSGVIRSIYLHGLFSVPLLAAISSEFGSDVVRSILLAARLQKSEFDLRQSERRLEQAAEAANMGSWEWSVSRDEIWTTDQGRKMFGLGPGELINLNRFLATLHAADRDAVHASVRKLLQEHNEYEQEYRIVLQDNRVRWMATRGRIEVDADGRPTVVRGVSIDITERKLAEERFREVVEGAPYGLVMVNAHGVIALVNAHVETAFGYAREELVGQPVEILVPRREHVQHADFVAAFSGDTSPRSVVKGRQFLALRKDGGEFPTEILLNPIQGTDGPMMLATIIDITARNKSELELERQRNELTHLSRVMTLSELSGSLAHELNQPLMAILNNAESALHDLAQDEPNLDEVREILEDIVSDDRRAGDVIQGLRLLLQKGGRRPVLLDINDVFRDVLKLMRSDLLNANVTVTTQLASTLPMIDGDRVQLQQVLLNLVVNGCDAMAGNDLNERCLLIVSELADVQSSRRSLWIGRHRERETAAVRVGAGVSRTIRP